ncbi:MAG TPA: cell wall-binding repeat-containing protein [Coriobacteriia bacterium]
MALALATVLAFTLLPAAPALAADAEHEPANNMHTGMDIVTPGSIMTGGISPAGDADWFGFPVATGRWYSISVEGVSGFDPMIQMYEATGVNRLSLMDSQWTGVPFPGAVSKDVFVYYHATSTGHVHFAVTAGASGGTGAYEIKVAEVASAPAVATTVRLGGADRYEVAANNMREGWTLAGTTNVIIASGLDKAMADPLTASGLAGVYNAPILLVRADRPTLPAYTATAIAQLKAANPGNKLKFYFVGGPASVPDYVKTRILAVAPGSTFERLGGADRYEVAANVAARMRSVLGPAHPKACFITNGQNPTYFPDSLACGPYAYKQHFPILLVKGGGSVPAVTETARKLYTTRYLVGSKSALPDPLPTKLGAMRLEGNGRAQVARLLAEHAFDWMGAGWLDRTLPRKLVIANKLSDALTAGAFGGKVDAALLYTATNADNMPDQDTQEYLLRHSYNVTGKIYIDGGPATIPDIVVLMIQRLMGLDVS